MDLIFFPYLVSIIAWNFLNATKGFDFCFKKWAHTILVLSYVKVVKNWAPPTEVIFIKPHKYVCTNSRKVLSIFFGFPFWKGFLHCLPLTQPTQKSSWWLVLTSRLVTKFFCTRNLKFCFSRWLNFSCQTFKFYFSWAIWTLSWTDTCKQNNIWSLFSFTTFARIFLALFLFKFYF